MGHDIFAECPKVSMEDWPCLRRAAASPMAKAIYIALNCEELNGGSSGRGERRVFSRQQIESAREFLLENDFADLKPDDRVLNLMERMRTFLPADCEITVGGPHDDDVVREIEFLNDCLASMDRHASGQITIHFS